MFSIFPDLIARLKALVLMFIVADLEADLIAAAAERKAELLRQANQYEHDDLPGIAEQVRKQTEALATDKPLASVTAAIAHLQEDSDTSANATVPLPTGPQPESPAAESPRPTAKKKNMTDLSRALARHVRTVFGPLRRRGRAHAGRAGDVPS